MVQPGKFIRITSVIGKEDETIIGLAWDGTMAYFRTENIKGIEFLDVSSKPHGLEMRPGKTRYILLRNCWWWWWAIRSLLHRSNLLFRFITCQSDPDNHGLINSSKVEGFQNQFHCDIEESTCNVCIKICGEYISYIEQIYQLQNKWFLRSVNFTLRSIL